jgi:putative membrane protein insertion efficiency factor
MAKYLGIILVYGYRWLIAPLLPAGSCKFHPSCSQYALDALALHGARRGTWLAVRRVARCHPWHPGGFDPVPDPNTRSITVGSPVVRTGAEPT